jgi:hypothetical protein
MAFLQHLRIDLRSSGMLRSVDWLLVTNVLRQPVHPIFKGQVIKEVLLGLLVPKRR